MDWDAVITLGVFLAAQTGAFLFYAGMVWRAMKNHDQRLEQLERDERATALSIAAQHEHLVLVNAGRRRYDNG